MIRQAVRRLQKTTMRGTTTPTVSWLALMIASTLWAGGCGTSGADTADTQEVEIGAVVVTQWNDSTELFLEYPHPVAGEATGNWAIHLTDMA